jgi:hypothetical protein
LDSDRHRTPPLFLAWLGSEHDTIADLQLDADRPARRMGEMIVTAIVWRDECEPFGWI